MHGHEVKTYFTFIEIIFTGTLVAELTGTADERTLAVVEEKLVLNPICTGVALNERTPITICPSFQN
jgi:hypothetical protein